MKTSKGNSQNEAASIMLHCTVSYTCAQQAFEGQRLQFHTNARAIEGYGAHYDIFEVVSPASASHTRGI